MKGITWSRGGQVPGSGHTYGQDAGLGIFAKYARSASRWCNEFRDCRGWGDLAALLGRWRRPLRVWHLWSGRCRSAGRCGRLVTQSHLWREWGGSAAQIRPFACWDPVLLAGPHAGQSQRPAGVCCEAEFHQGPCATGCPSHRWRWPGTRVELVWGCGMRR